MENVLSHTLHPTPPVSNMKSARHNNNQPQNSPLILFAHGTQSKMKIFNLFSISPVLSRPSSPAATASRHSSHTSSVTNRVNQPTQSVNQNQIMIVNEKKNHKKLSKSIHRVDKVPLLSLFYFINIFANNPTVVSFLRKQQPQPSQTQTPHNDVINFEQQTSPAHHRANSGPTIAISLFPEAENSNCTNDAPPPTERQSKFNFNFRLFNLPSAVMAPMPGSPHTGIGSNVHAATPPPVMTGSTCSNAGGQLWKTRLTNIKNSVLGSPRFHRRKMQGKRLFAHLSIHPLSSIGDTKENSLCPDF